MNTHQTPAGVTLQSTVQPELIPQIQHHHLSGHLNYAGFTFLFKVDIGFYDIVEALSVLE